MPRPKAEAPAISRHLSGQAIVKIDGVTFYLGKYNSAESFAKYAVLVRAYQENGFQLPDDMTPECIRNLDIEHAKVQPIVDLSKEPVRVKHVTEGYLAFVKERFAGQPKEIHRFTKLTEDVRQHDGEKLASEYGPLALQEQRKRWEKSGTKSRSYCNRLTNEVVRMFEWAVSQEKVSESVWTRLTSVKPLIEGYSSAHETDSVLPVNIEVVRATAKHLSPVLKAMLRVHVATGMRPSELCNMRPCDIDRSGDIWVYRLREHKTRKKGKNRVVPILGDAKEALMDYLNRPADAYCFSPKESTEWFRAQQRANRQSNVQPSQQDRSKPNPQKQPGNKYDSGSYRQAIQRAAKTAKVKEWHPYQLRHLAATLVREALGPEAAQHLLGHSNIRMTERYAQLSESMAIEAAKAAPQL